jgi:RNA polymerase sigma-70 factor (sigma-E family)
MMASMGVVGRTPPDSAATETFASFYSAQHEPMLRLAYLLTQSRAIAEELVQDCFIRVQPRWATLDEPAAYLRRAVTNACYSYHRRRHLEQAIVAEPSGVAPAPEYDEMWDALARLAPRRRAVLVLRYYLDLSEAEIADTIGCRPGTVKSISHRALADLRKVLKP